MRPLLISLLCGMHFFAMAQKDPYLFVGTYSERGSEGIYVYRFDTKTGAMTPVSVASALKSPSFLALSPDKNKLYAVAENDSGSVGAFQFNAQTGKLQFLNAQSSRGVWPCHVAVDATGKWCMVGNYGSGNVAVLPVKADGSLAPAHQTLQHEGKSANAERQEKAHVHSINIAANNRDVFVADLGTDKIMAYTLDATSGKLQSGNPPFALMKPGGGPRHFAFHPKKAFAYGVLELSCEVQAFRYEKGKLTDIQRIGTLPADFKGANTCADIHVSPDGKFLYVSNRGHHSLAIFKINQLDGTLKLVGHQSVMGETPRNFALSPDGKFVLVANQNTDTIQLFRRNKHKGTLRHLGEAAKVSMPVCLIFR